MWILPRVLFTSRLHHFRRYSIEYRGGTKVEIPIGGSGNVQIDIFPPLSNPVATSETLIYLPPGPPLTGNTRNATTQPNQIPALLSSLLPTSTIITLNYRLVPPELTFPLPIHDVTAAFNHILRTSPSQISLLGTRLGGTLATTLALTSLNAIHSVAVCDPILDWVSLDDGADRTPSDPPPTTSPPTLTRKKPRLSPYTTTDAKSLLALRSQLFPKPDNYFDAFASPMLFLRAPGRDCPQPASEQLGSYDDDHRARSPPTAESALEEVRPTRRRKVLRRWPPNALPESVRLPHFRVLVSNDMQGEGLVLRQQGEELVDLMRRVCSYGLGREVVEGRVGVEVVPRDDKSENDGEGEMVRIERAARWLADRQKVDG